jgi:hypothetical protein
VAHRRNAQLFQVIFRKVNQMRNVELIRLESVGVPTEV